MPDNPVISVIMSVYNGQQYLAESIESILNQTFRDFEFIIINDGSTDSTKDIIDKYAEKEARISVIHQENIGLTKSLNKGLQSAKGMYMARQDCGDMSCLKRLAKQLEFLKKNPQLSVCFTWTKVINELSREIGEFAYSTRPYRIHKTLASGKNIYTHGSVMIRKEDILGVGGYDEEMSVSQDYELWLRLIKNGYKIGGVKNFLYKWRLIPESISIKNNRLQKEFCYIALEKNQYNSTRRLKTYESYKDPILHWYQNILFRGQARTLLLKNTLKLLKNKELSKKELFKCVAVFIPVSYKWLFKLM